MKLLNNTGKDLMVPLRMPVNSSGVYQPINHIVVKNGEVMDMPEDSLEAAKLMGMTENIEVLKAKINTQVVETKVIKEKKLLTEKEIFDMNVKEQKSLLKKLGVEKSPRFEKDRVKLILELQGGS